MQLSMFYMLFVHSSLSVSLIGLKFKGLIWGIDEKKLENFSNNRGCDLWDW